MKILIPFAERYFRADLSAPNSIALPIKADSQAEKAASAWYCPPVQIEAVKLGDWVGTVAAGSGVNFFNIKFNPHGNGCHTECVGHISAEKVSVFQELKEYHFLTYLVSVAPKLYSEGEYKGDYIIEKAAIEKAVAACLAATKVSRFLSETKAHIPALVLRTLPNDEGKKQRQYTETNPPYLSEEAMLYISETLDIQHFIIDLPSVDKEKDGGKLSAHHIFWAYPQAPRLSRTITEFAFVADSLKDDIYFLQLAIAAFENDASPSNPTLYALEWVDKL
jgi:kynurenine formamidase